MKKSPALVMFAVLTLLPATFLPGQSATTSKTPASTVSPADQAWEDLRLVIFALPDPDIEAAPDGVALSAALKRQAAKFVTNADRAKDFYTQNPKHAKAAEARKLESVLLMQAVLTGDVSNEGRMESTVQAFCEDRTVAESQRAEVAGIRGFQGALRKGRTPGGVSANTENVARSLIVSYPSQPQGYESLLTIASEREMAKSRALATEILGMPAPLPVKEGAQLLVERYNLVGKPLAQILSDAGAAQARSTIQKGRPTIIYTWASWSPGSLVLGEMLAKRDTAKANIIGLNLDEDTSASDKLAKTRKLSGSHVYDQRGAKGALAQGLKVNSAPLVYFVDEQGVIRDVRGLDGLEQKLTENGL